ncbi:unnamed protein product [Meloidogyne enterolobii]|uniref:Uncharacterized protein n=1 Tax=Meloidogyne enterolobii TaxID=390850 RepID=A0ACB1B0J3_MELEN
MSINVQNRVLLTSHYARRCPVPVIDAPVWLNQANLRPLKESSSQKLHGSRTLRGGRQKRHVEMACRKGIKLLFGQWLRQRLVLFAKYLRKAKGRVRNRARSRHLRLAVKALQHHRLAVRVVHLAALREVAALDAPPVLLGALRIVLAAQVAALAAAHLVLIQAFAVRLAVPVQAVHHGADKGKMRGNSRMKNSKYIKYIKRI